MPPRGLLADENVWPGGFTPHGNEATLSCTYDGFVRYLMSFEMLRRSLVSHTTDCVRCACRVEDYDDINNPPVSLADGSPVPDVSISGKAKKNKQEMEKGVRSYLGHLKEKSYNRTLTDKYKLVLFHYVTRSLEDYTSRKISLKSGMYKEQYVKQYGKKQNLDLSDPIVMAEFEQANDFDGTAPICSSAQTAQYVSQCCGGNM